MRLRFAPRDLYWAWLAATVFSGLPSTLWAWLTGADPLAPTRAAGATLIPPDAGTPMLLAAAAIVHPAVSAFWTLVFGLVLPRDRVLAWAVLGSAGVALLDLGLIAPFVFPEIAALPFWPQFADHLMWGTLLGGTLQLRTAH